MLNSSGPPAPQRQEETHSLLPAQSVVQLPFHQRVIVEQYLHAEPQLQPDVRPQLQEQQSQFLLELHLRDSGKSQQESQLRKVEEKQQNQAIAFRSRTKGWR